LTRTRILLAEDHKDVRDRVVRLLEPEFEVVGTVGDGLALLEAAARMKPDVCVLDISMPKMSGIEAAAQLRKRGSAVKVVFLTVHEDADFVRAALATDALGYVVKSRMASDLRSAIREALAERLFVSPSCCFAMQEKPSPEEWK
jgi:DNA-binding NarL/FixJ family response regulator